MKTTLGTIFTAIGFVPLAISQLNLTEVPNWLVTVGLVASFISFIYTGVNTKDTPPTA